MPRTLRQVARGLALGLLLFGSMPRTAFAATDFERYLSSTLSLYEDLEYERALKQLERARKAAVGVEQDMLLSMYEGAILADMGRWEEARAAFRTALSLDPEAKLPLTYGLLLWQWPLIVTNGVCLLLSGFILGMKLLPRRKREEVAEALDPTT